MTATMPKAAAAEYKRGARRILNRRQAAEKLGVSERTLYRMELPIIQLSPGRVGYPEDRLDDWIDSRTRAA